MHLFKVTEPRSAKVPIIVSSPHSGTFFPDEVKKQLKPQYHEHPDDTDWFIDQLYDFVPDLGITLLAANYNRWVIDLNRDPESKPLYNDGRVITGLVTTTTFNGDNLYIDEMPNQEEVNRRVENYYKPYHFQLQSMIEKLKNQFGRVLLFDVHSIRKVVPGIRKEAFPDLILGDNDQLTAASHLINTAYNALGKKDYQLTHNFPFKGGYITRHYGNPSQNIHALQLEMAKTNYMDDTEIYYDVSRADKIRELLTQMFKQLISVI